MANKKTICGIYKIINPAGLIYIGQSIDLIRRIKRYNYYDCKNNRRLYESMIQFGCNNHKIKIIKKCKSNELDKWEQFYIKKYNSLDEQYGFNLQSGGKVNFIASNETKRKHSENTKGENNPNYGKKHSKSTKEKISKAHIGRKIPIEIRLKMGQSKKGTHMDVDHHAARTIAQFDRSGNLINIHGSLSQAARSVNKSVSGIHSVCKNRRPTCGGYIWRYL